MSLSFQPQPDDMDPILAELRAVNVRRIEAFAHDVEMSPEVYTMTRLNVLITELIGPEGTPDRISFECEYERALSQAIDEMQRQISTARWGM